MTQRQIEKLTQKIIEMGPAKAHKIFKKASVYPECPIDYSLLATWYTPGIAEPCRMIMKDYNQLYRLTSKGNRLAIVSDGTRPLGLRSEGVWGPHASMPIMEGKAFLFRALGAVEGVPLMLGHCKKDGKIVVPTVEEFTNIVKFTQENYGGINLEDIETIDDKCHKILHQLREDVDVKIPVWHDDQQGTATIVIAGLINALKIAGKKKENIKIACVGSGAVMVATIKLMKAWGILPSQIRLADEKGTVDSSRDDIDDNTETGKLKNEVEQMNVIGSKKSKEAIIKGSDVLIAASVSIKGGLINPKLIKLMNKKSIVFAMANPYPEIDPEHAKKEGAFIAATGRSDFPNQVNNACAFPGIFRGVFDVRAETISDKMTLSASEAIAKRAQKINEFGENFILPHMDDITMAVDVAANVSMQAMKENLAGKPIRDEEDYKKDVRKRIEKVRKVSEILVNLLEIK